jgi:hypothetical protein
MQKEMETRRVRKDVNLDPKVIKWVQAKMKDGTYWNFSHCVESLIKEKMNGKGEGRKE